tara:strand:+ start:307 stop:984 length:678 start_codon:yes stop_codon:yes gene_type:complete
MKVNIEQNGKQNKFNLINNWDDVCLETYGKLIDYKKGSKTDDAVHILSSMTDIPNKFLKTLELHDALMLLSKVAVIQEEDNSILRERFTIEGITYAFHPKLDNITLGEYADIEHFVELGFQEHLPEIMAVLFRPVVKDFEEGYTIEAYDGEIEERTKIFKTMKAKQVQSALVFFWSLGSELLLILKSFSIQEHLKEQLKDLTEILQENGDGSELCTASQMEKSMT